MFSADFKQHTSAGKSARLTSRSSFVRRPLRGVELKMPNDDTIRDIHIVALEEASLSSVPTEGLVLFE